MCRTERGRLNQLWFVGPIAQRTGDLGVEMALVATPAFLYALQIDRYQGPWTALSISLFTISQMLTY